DWSSDVCYQLIFLSVIVPDEIVTYARVFLNSEEGAWYRTYHPRTLLLKPFLQPFSVLILGLESRFGLRE
ncbi:hypothetical protein P3677_24190, partial [Vibrio parahaemolyticus]|nr:hypothetical protein [Vibrio parahaemolyticus]